MKITTKEPVEEKVWKPVDIILTIESVREARLLFHAFNHAKLYEAIKESQGYNIENYDSDCAMQMGSPSTIEKIIEAQGYKV